MKEVFKGEVPEPTERTPVVPIQAQVVSTPSPTIYGHLPDDENTPPVTGSSGRVTVDKPPPPSILPLEGISQGVGRLNPDKSTVGDGYYQDGQSQNLSLAFPCPKTP